MFHIRYRMDALKRFALLAFGIHLTLGNFCMMQMASAHPMTSHAEHGAMEMRHGMMASEDCAHCPQNESESQEQESPCANGHCFSGVASTTSSLSSHAFGAGIAPTSASVVIQIAPLELPVRPLSTSPPDTHLITQTIVLRC